jgi:hypothetical protein
MALSIATAMGGGALAERRILLVVATHTDVRRSGRRSCQAASITMSNRILECTHLFEDGERVTFGNPIPELTIRLAPTTPQADPKHKWVAASTSP